MMHAKVTFTNGLTGDRLRGWLRGLGELGVEAALEAEQDVPLVAPVVGEVVAGRVIGRGSA